MTNNQYTLGDYFTTYGWAILAIAIVGSLLYTQVFSQTTTNGTMNNKTEQNFISGQYLDVVTNCEDDLVCYQSSAERGTLDCFRDLDLIEKYCK